jgi:hypothetical protein
MTDNVENDIGQRVEKALTEDLSAIDKNTTSKLRAARYQALENYERDRQRRYFFGSPTRVSGLILACSFFVVVGVWVAQLPPTQVDEHTHDGQAVLYQIETQRISSSELELVEELEFYEWIDSNGYAG